MQRTPVFPNLHISQDPVHRRRRGALLLVLILLVTAAAGVGSWWYTAGRFTTVPSVTQVSEAVAREAASANNVKVETRTEYSEDVAAGLIISTDPSGGTRVLRGDSMELVISLGPERFSMPEVVGLTLDEATDALESTNLVVGDVVESWSEDIAAEVVMSASQDPGASLKRDTAINMGVSKGPEPISITDYTGREASLAAKELESAGFEVRVSQENSGAVGKGLVLSQTPSSGSGKRGDTIELVESLGPVLVEVPDVRYMRLDEAKQELEAAGLEVEVEYSSDFPLTLQIAAGTDPGSGTSVPEGSKVVLQVV